MNSPAQTLLARLAALTVFAIGLGVSASRLFVGVAEGVISAPGAGPYDIMEHPLPFVLVAAAWTAVGLMCFVGCVAFLWGLLAKPRLERELGKRPRSGDPAP